MGYLRKIAGSPYWQAVFINEKHVEVQRSTKTSDREAADLTLNSWAISAQLLRQDNLCLHRRRAVVAEMSKLVGGDTTPLITFESYRDGYVARSCAEIQTRGNRKSGLKAFALFLGENVKLPLEDIVKPHIIGFRDHLFALDREPQTVKQRIEVLHTFFEDAVIEQVIKHNPAAGVLVRIPKDKQKGTAKKRKALSFDEGVKLVDAASVEELVVAMMGLDLGARLGDAFGLELPRINLRTGRISYWVEKADIYLEVDLFPATLPLLNEYVQYHRPKTDSPLLLPTIGISSGPDVDERKHKSELTGACTVIHELVQRAQIGELVVRKSGTAFNTVSYHCFRITNNNALKMAGLGTEWVMWRLCQKDKKANKDYDRFNPDNAKKAIFGVLGFKTDDTVAAASTSEDVKAANDGSMTFLDMMELIAYARQKLLAIRLGHNQVPPKPQITMFD